jgi:hypothetical protein
MKRERLQQPWCSDHRPSERSVVAPGLPLIAFGALHFSRSLAFRSDLLQSVAQETNSRVYG